MLLFQKMWKRRKRRNVHLVVITDIYVASAAAADNDGDDDGDADDGER